ncbi:uncharacterized protein [Primulina eburnea]|uniref:uncharacterized protein n=1 Tax=Primulina eburnea TaxID=1245227 RepID=UPI003C6C2573
MIYRKRPLRFSLLEYCLLTGLNCSNVYPMIPEEDEFRERHFGGSYSIRLGDLIDRIDEYDNDFGGEIDIEKVKLACLLFVVGVLGRHRKNKNDTIDLEWIRLVNNFDSFINYPWGRIAFEEVVYGLREYLETKFRSYENLVARRSNDPDFSGFGSFHISGFVHPLQILAYEYFPSIAQVFARPRKGPNVPIPRMCHWLTRKWSKNHSPSMDDVNKAFKNVNNKDILGILIPTSEERVSVHYMTGNFVDSNNVIINRITELICRGIQVVCTQDPLGDLEDEVGVQTETEDRPFLQPFTYTYSRSSRDKVRKSSRPSRSPSHMNPPSPPLSPPLTHTHFSPPLTHTRDHVADMYELRFISLEDKVETIQKDQADIKNQLKNIHDDISSLKDIFGRLSSMNVNVDQGETSSHRFEDIPFEVDPNIPLVSDPSLTRAFEKTSGGKLRLFTVEEEPMTEEELRRLVVNDMMSVSFQKRVRMFANRSWPRVSAEINCPTENRMICGLCSSYDSSWFRVLGTPASWLTETHIQECCRGLLELQRTYSHFMSQEVSLMDVDFHQLVSSAFNEGGEYNIECLMPYVRAEISEWPAIPWNKAKIILIPFHLPGHWVLLKVLPNRKNIKIMDSDRSVDRSGKTLLKLINPLSLMLPHMLGVDSSERWSIVRPKLFLLKRRG